MAVEVDRDREFGNGLGLATQFSLVSRGDAEHAENFSVVDLPRRDSAIDATTLKFDERPRGNPMRLIQIATGTIIALDT